MAKPILAREYDVGDSVRTSAYFKVSGVLTDPDTVTVRYKDPSGTTTYFSTPDPRIVQDETGVYHTDIFLEESGDWFYRWEGSGTVRAARERRLTVRPSEF